MKILIASIGRLKSSEEKPLFDRYLKRSRDFGKSVGVKSIELIELPESRNQNVAKRKEEEANSIMSSLPNPNFLIALDQTGESQGNNELSDLIQQQRSLNTKNLVFAIGGADGLSPNILKKTNFILAFGAMTWPHQLVRIMLVEQIYRSFTILAGHPYHRM